MKPKKPPSKDEAKGRPPYFSDWERMQLKSPIPTQAPPKEFIVVSRLFQKLALREEHGGPYTRESIQGVFGGLEKMMTLMREFLFGSCGGIHKDLNLEGREVRAQEVGMDDPLEDSRLGLRSFEP
nr:hypothetical protein CFP56_49250 [Quercus suber]